MVKATTAACQGPRTVSKDQSDPRQSNTEVLASWCQLLFFNTFPTMHGGGHLQSQHLGGRTVTVVRGQHIQHQVCQCHTAGPHLTPPHPYSFQWGWGTGGEPLLAMATVCLPTVVSARHTAWHWKFLSSCCFFSLGIASTCHRATLPALLTQHIT